MIASSAWCFNHVRSVRLQPDQPKPRRHEELSLLVAILESRDEPKAHVMAFTAREGIEAVDCTVPDQGQLQVPGYSHPDRRINAHWARCIGDRLRARL